MRADRVPFPRPCAGLESEDFIADADEDEKGLSNAMGLFLQKTNIIRDYLEARVVPGAWEAPVSGACTPCAAPPVDA
jgi:hypothetical protein